MGEVMRESVDRIVTGLEGAGVEVVAWTDGGLLPASQVFVAWRCPESWACALEAYDWQCEESLGVVGVFNDSEYEVAVEGGEHSATCEGCPIAHCPQRGV